MPLKPYVASAFLLAFHTAHASPSINIKTSYYAVQGNDASSIQQSIQQNGPLGKNGERYHAVTSWNAQWSYRWLETGPLCRLTDVEVSIDVEYLLPQLASTEDIEKSYKIHWDKYFKALYKHEKQHKDFGVQAAIELEKELLAIKNQQACQKLDNKISATAQKVLDKYNRLEKEFDQATSHGINQGVKLP